MLLPSYKLTPRAPMGNSQSSRSAARQPETHSKLDGGSICVSGQVRSSSPRGQISLGKTNEATRILTLHVQELLLCEAWMEWVNHTPLHPHLPPPKPIGFAPKRVGGTLGACGDSVPTGACVGTQSPHPVGTQSPQWPAHPVGTQSPQGACALGFGLVQ
jgi:hypothetical protein